MEEKKRVSAWVNATAAELQRLSGPGDAIQFRQTPIVDAADIMGSFSKSHTAWRLELEARLATLRSIMNR